jgi:hypothetical protein
MMFKKPVPYARSPADKPKDSQLARSKVRTFSSTSARRPDEAVPQDIERLAENDIIPVEKKQKKTCHLWLFFIPP